MITYHAQLHLGTILSFVNSQGYTKYLTISSIHFTTDKEPIYTIVSELDFPMKITESKLITNINTGRYTIHKDPRPYHILEEDLFTL